MSVPSTSAIRQSFLKFFEARGHEVVASDSLLPSTDPTLLFTSAGMVQFKPNFQNPDASPYRRAASCQKCLRTSDIERVGYTLRHLTFFEMLGNFSFGDYFKAESIAWGWEFITRTMGLPADRFIVSVYKDDDEAFAIWKKLVPESRIVRLGDDSNFWTMGPTGPCGPCSEILWDRGDAWGKAGDFDSDRYLEVWNHVFTQFDRSADGTLKPLPRKNIDTGMGLERLSLVVQGVASAFETDGFRRLFGALADISKTPAPPTPAPGSDRSPAAAMDATVAFRRIADHVRAVTFMAADGILPSNEGRGYVLRRLLRQAQRAGKTLGLSEPFLHRLTATVVEQMRDAYPDLTSRHAAIVSMVRLEEEKFLETLESGTRRFEALVQQAKAKRQAAISGADAFQLYETFGFPWELTLEMAKSEQMRVDEAEFRKAQDHAAERARAGWKGSGAKDVDHYRAWKTKTGLSATVFRGYDTLEVETPIQATLYRPDPTSGGWTAVDQLTEGEIGEAVLSETPFYAEGGGQVGDVGAWRSDTGEAEVLDTQAPVEGFTVHRLRVTRGSLRAGQSVKATVDRRSREATMRHHTATHLLHKALRHVLGPHVTQAGSLVAPDRLRFDFTHTAPLTPEQVRQIEDLVNEQILKDTPVQAEEVGIADARGAGAMMLFGEKYGQRVRTIRVSDQPWAEAASAWSLELCGGTHVHATGEIGLVKITSETALGAGVRRMEAVAGLVSLETLRRTEERVQKAAGLLRTTPDDLLASIEKLMNQKKDLERAVAAEKSAALHRQVNQARQSESDGLKIVTQTVPGLDEKLLREAADRLRDSLRGDVTVVATTTAEGKVRFVVAVRPEAAGRVKAGDVAKALSARLEGAGGGRADFAQGGGKNAASLDAALAELPTVLKSASTR